MAAVLAFPLAITNGAALGSWLVQHSGLITPGGVTPIDDPPPTREAAWKKFRKRPSLFHFLAGDRRGINAVFAVGAAGVALQLAASALPLLVVGGGLAGTAAAGLLGSLGAGLCYLSYASFTDVSQPWLGLQMDANLPETNALFCAAAIMMVAAAFALFAWASEAPLVWVTRWTIFRVMVGCGAAKYSGGDPTWRDLTAMSYHYETQPLPNGLSWYAHFAPMWVHKVESAVTFVLECGLPLLYAGGSWTRMFAFLLTCGFNAAIGVTGNYGHLHLLTIAEAVALIIETDCDSTAPWARLLTTCTPPAAIASPLLAGAFATLQYAAATGAWALAIGYMGLSFPPLARTFEGIVELLVPVPWYGVLEQWSAVASSRFKLCNYYSKFTSMTTARWELQLEGSADGGASWHAYGYVCKPGGPLPQALDTRPRTLPVGYIPRLDWRMWFIPLAVMRAMRRGYRPHQVPVEGWYRAFCERVLEGQPDVLGHLQVPPALQGRVLSGVRTRIYHYTFTTPAPPAMLTAPQQNAGGVVTSVVSAVAAPLQRLAAVVKGPSGTAPSDATAVGGEMRPRGDSAGASHQNVGTGGSTGAPTVAVPARAPASGVDVGKWWTRRLVCPSWCELDAPPEQMARAIAQAVDAVRQDAEARAWGEQQQQGQQIPPAAAASLPEVVAPAGGGSGSAADASGAAGGEQQPAGVRQRRRQL